MEKGSVRKCYPCIMFHIICLFPHLQGSCCKGISPAAIKGGLTVQYAVSEILMPFCVKIYVCLIHVCKMEQQYLRNTENTLSLVVGGNNIVLQSP